MFEEVLKKRCNINGRLVAPPMTGEAAQHAEGRPLGLLRAVALIVVVVGVLGSFGLVLRVGHYNFNILMLLFTIWDLSPFFALIVADTVSKPFVTTPTFPSPRGSWLSKAQQSSSYQRTPAY